MLTIPPLHVSVLTELRTVLTAPHHSPPPPPPPPAAADAAAAATFLPINNGQEDPDLAVKIFSGNDICGLQFGAVQTMLCYRGQLFLLRSDTFPGARS